MKNLDFVLSAFMESRQMIAKVNTMRSTIEFIKHEDPAVHIGLTHPLAEYFGEYLANNRIHQEDIARFDLFFSPEQLRRKCVAGTADTLFSFRRLVGNKLRWTMVVLCVPECYDDRHPEVMLCWRNLSQEAALDEDAKRAISERVLKIIRVDLGAGLYQLIRIPREEEQLRERYDADHSETVSRRLEQEMVYQEDRELFRSEMEPEHLISYFRAGNREKAFYYRRRSHDGYQWVKLLVHPASEYSESNPVFLILIVDVHRTVNNFFARQGRREFMQRHKHATEEVETYYENILNVLSSFTQQYLDYYMVDLEKDMYIKYKISRDVLDGATPYVGRYSDVSSLYLQGYVAEDEAARLAELVSRESLQEMLADKISAEFDYTLIDGRRVRTCCTRTAASGGMPTKVLCRTILLSDENRLKVTTFGNFEVYDREGRPIRFTKKLSKQLLAYLVDKYGFPASTVDLVTDVLEKPSDDLNAKKYVSTLFRSAAADLEKAGYTDIIIKEWNSLRINVEKLDCDYYHLMEGDSSYWMQYRNEYMKEYSWAEETNAELLQMGNVN